MEYLMMKDIEHSKVTPFISYSPTPHKGVLTRGQDSKSLRRIDLESWPCVNTLYSAWEVDSCKHVWRQPWGAEAPEVHLLMTNMWSMKKSWEGTIRRWDATCWEARWRWDYVGLRWDFVERQITSWSSWLKRCIFFNWRRLSNFALANANTIYNPTFELRTHWSGDTLYR